MEEKQEEKDMGETDTEEKDMEERRLEGRKGTASRAKGEASKDGIKEAERGMACMTLTYGVDKDKVTMALQPRPEIS